MGRQPKPYGPTWNRRALEVLSKFARVVPCTHCQQPVAEGWCCTWCDMDPTQSLEDQGKD
jgi:hypothetical protein